MWPPWRMSVTAWSSRRTCRSKTGMTPHTKSRLKMMGGLWLSIPIFHSIGRHFLEAFHVDQFAFNVAIFIWTVMVMLMSLGAIYGIVRYGRRRDSDSPQSKEPT